MACKIVPPVSLDEVSQDLNDPTWAIYMVIGKKEDDAWLTAESVVSDMARSHAILLTKRSDADDWNSEPEASGWPVPSAWSSGKPVGICFGFGATPLIYLRRDQAEDIAVVGAAHVKAQEMSQA